MLRSWASGLLLLLATAGCSRSANGGGPAGFGSTASPPSISLPPASQGGAPGATGARGPTGAQGPQGPAGRPATSDYTNVKDMGAVGDGKADDTAAIQSTVNAVARAGGGTVLVPAGTYMIQTVAPTLGVALVSSLTLQMSPGAILRAFPNSADNYSILRVYDASNVTILGGTVQGERSQHGGTTGEWGMGVDMRGATNVTIRNVTAKDCWGDGFYVGQTATFCQDINFQGCVSDNNRRQGLSIVDCRRATVQGCTFSNTKGTAPMAGIDVEPNPGCICEDISITGCHFFNNEEAVCVLNSSTQRVVISGNTSTANTYGYFLEYGCSQVILSGNTITRSIGPGILVSGADTQYNTISGNVVSDGAMQGILVQGSTHNSFTGNIVFHNSQMADNAYANIQLEAGASDNNVQNNTCRMGSTSSRPSYGILLATADCKANLVTSNDLATSGASASFLDLGTGTVTTAGNRP